MKTTKNELGGYQTAPTTDGRYVERFYDRGARSWAVVIRDKEGNQIGGCDHAGTKEGAISIAESQYEFILADAERARLKLKVFRFHYRGTGAQIVAVKSQREAATAFGASLHEVRGYASDSGNQTHIEVAMRTPGKVWVQETDRAEWEPKP